LTGIAPDITLAYDGDGVAEGRGLKEQADANSEFDVKAAIDHVASAGAVGVVGFCWGGSLAWRMACDKTSGLAAAISYYGGELPSLAGRDAAYPVMAHFGIHDTSIPEAGARSFATAQPSVETHFYDAGFGFNCDYRGQHDADAAALAWGRTMAFFWKRIWPDTGRGWNAEYHSLPMQSASCKSCDYLSGLK
jgi:carboxymethylenebutenolidase